MFKTRASWGLVWLVCMALGCQRYGAAGTDRRVLTVFAAASLAPLLQELSAAFGDANPGVEVHLELSASRVACMKVASQGREADVVLSADAELIDALLIPAAASFNVLFARNSLVLAYSPGSLLAASLQAGTPWQRALARGDWRVGIANPQTAPVGYRALLALQLNDALAAPDLRLGSTIAATLRPAWQRPDVSKLLAPLQAGDLDAAFVYRSEALQHGLPYVRLGPRMDFSDPAHQALYASAHLRLPEGDEVRGSTAWYGLTIPTAAPRPTLARLFVNHLLSESGRRMAAEHHLPLAAAGELQVHGRTPPGLLASAER